MFFIMCQITVTDGLNYTLESFVYTNTRICVIFLYFFGTYVLIHKHILNILHCSIAGLIIGAFLKYLHNDIADR